MTARHEHKKVSAHRLEHALAPGRRHGVDALPPQLGERVFEPVPGHIFFVSVFTSSRSIFVVECGSRLCWCTTGPEYLRRIYSLYYLLSYHYTHRQRQRVIGRLGEEVTWNQVNFVKPVFLSCSAPRTKKALAKTRHGEHGSM